MGNIEVHIIGIGRKMLRSEKCWDLSLSVWWLPVRRGQ